MSTLETNLIQPATGTALTVGASGDTITVPAGATFNVAGTLQEGGSALVTGKVLQVINSISTTEYSKTSGGYTDTFSASITPASTSNKILVFGHVAIAKNASDCTPCLKLLRDSTDLKEYLYLLDTNDTQFITGFQGFSYLDSPSSTSSLTYKVQYRISNSGTVYVSPLNQPSDLTLMEIAG
jgi:hypothetical protein